MRSYAELLEEQQEILYSLSKFKNFNPDYKFFSRPEIITFFVRTRVLISPGKSEWQYSEVVVPSELPFAYDVSHFDDDTTLDAVYLHHTRIYAAMLRMKDVKGMMNLIAVGFDVDEE